MFHTLDVTGQFRFVFSFNCTEYLGHNFFCIDSIYNTNIIIIVYIKFKDIIKANRSQHEIRKYMKKFY